ncbi:MAG: hypothetical protein E7632_01020 [Ruminococcaceae bacterium]|nr:hypothetical protein [Oscillospiraceae bacterium]
MRQKELAEAYYAQPVEIFHGDPSEPNTCIKRFADSGVHFREITIETGKGGDVIEIDQITDVHFNYCNEKDLTYPELAYTVTCRKWLANAAAVPGCKRAMEAAKFADLVVVTGDSVDYLTEGAIDLTWEHIWGVDPDALVTLGGHDVTRQMQTGRPNEASIEERYAVVEAAWKHDIYYESRILGDKVIAVALDNGQGHYWDCQIEKFAADLKLARERGMVILVFEHEPICTGNPEDRELHVFREYDKQQADFYHSLIGGEGAKPYEASKTLYEMIVGNADIVRGVFCGHRHSCFYSEIRGWYTDENGVRHEKTIPQPVLEANPYDSNAGHIMRIYVK